ncbi:hypothetical protein OG900_33640 [Streptomyces sp. NBC_00433]
MSGLSLLSAASEQATSSDDGLDHVYCCDPDIALCGTDISGADFAAFDAASCVVCADLDDTDAPCARCGYGAEVTS